MSRSRRLVEVVRQLKKVAPKALTAHQIAETFSVSERTIYRDMAKLIDSGVPIEGEAGLGYWLAPDDGPPPISLTWRQAQILWRGARLLALTAEEEFAADAVAAQNQLEKILGAQRIDRISGHPILSLSDKLRPADAVLSAFERARERGHAIRIIYVSLSDEDIAVEGVPTGITPIGEMRILTLTCPDGLIHIRAERVKKLTMRA
ncbi:helix-turn-helix transcriptional regulator [Hyphobacterium sp.]|uniref:helix-turn-helix transcriptional regulator n=1 Tax=Hyphobacterium sp. TaxID=2004662 RepID=UPI0037490F0A